MDFRNSFLESSQYSKTGNYDELKRKLFQEVRNQNYSEVTRIAKEMLSLDYTSLYALKFLSQTYGILGDTIKRNQYQEIEIGLLKSIINSGDAKTCETGWHVIKIEEEYFILNVLGIQVKSQSLIHEKKNSCDKMEGKDQKGQDHTFFFEINKVWELETKMFKK